MKAFARLVAAAATVVSALAAGHASAQNLVTNGSFEAGTAPWNIVAGACTFQTLPVGAPTAGAGVFTTPAPTNGAAVLMVDANAPGSCTISQDVALPSGTINTLGLDAGYFFRDFGGGAAGCSVTVNVTTTTAVLIANVFTGTGAVDIPMAARGVDLSPRAGTTVRIIATMTSCAGGPVGLAMDNVMLISAARVPTLGEWSMILLALLMVGAAAIHLRGRRRI